MRTEKFKSLFKYAPKSNLKASDGGESGNFPFYTSSSIVSKRTDKAQYYDEALIFGNGGSANVHYANEPFGSTSHCIVANPVSKDINVKYIYYYLFGNIHLLERGFKGVGLKNISPKYIENLDIPILPIDTQNKIVAILDKASKLIEKRDLAFKIIENFKWASFYYFFGDGKKYKWDSIKKIVSREKYSLSSGPFGSNLTSKDYVDEGGVIILRGKNITSGKLDLSNIKRVSEKKAIELKRSEIKPNDVVIIAVGSSGKALRIPQELNRAIVSQNFNKVTCDASKVNPSYFEFCFNSEIVQWQLRSIMTDAGRSFLSLTNIKEIKIPIPDIEIQNKFENTVFKVEKSFNNLFLSMNLLLDLSNSLTQNVFNSTIKFNDSENTVGTLNLGVDLSLHIDFELDVLVKEINLLEKINDLSKIEGNQKYLKRLITKLNNQEFKEKDLYDKAKHGAFQLMTVKEEERKVIQEYDEKSKSIKLALK